MSQVHPAAAIGPEHGGLRAAGADRLRDRRPVIGGGKDEPGQRQRQVGGEEASAEAAAEEDRPPDERGEQDPLGPDEGRRGGEDDGRQVATRAGQVQAGHEHGQEQSGLEPLGKDEHVDGVEADERSGRQGRDRAGAEVTGDEIGEERDGGEQDGVQRERELVDAVDAEDEAQSAQQEHEGGRGRAQHRAALQVPGRAQVAGQVPGMPEGDVGVVARLQVLRQQERTGGGSQAGRRHQQGGRAELRGQAPHPSAVDGVSGGLVRGLGQGSHDGKRGHGTDSRR